MRISRKLSVSAGRFKTAVSPPTLVKTAKFKLPHDMKGIMKGKGKVWREGGKEEDCYEAQTVVFTDNVYSYGQTDDQSVSIYVLRKEYLE